MFDGVGFVVGFYVGFFGSFLFGVVFFFGDVEVGEYVRFVGEVWLESVEK